MVKTSITAAFSRIQSIISQKTLSDGAPRRRGPPSRTQGTGSIPRTSCDALLTVCFFCFFCLCLRLRLQCLCSGLTGATHSHKAVNEWPHSVRSSKRLPECCPTLSVCHLKKKKINKKGRINVYCSRPSPSQTSALRLSAP